MKVAGANMSLGSELAMNFFVNKSDIQADKDYYIVLTKTYADGSEALVVTYEEVDWIDYNTNLWQIRFDKLAAKEMADKIYVQVFYADGTPASAVWEDSVRDYAIRMFPKGSAKQKAMYVDMLNYGAAAQEEFEYGQDDLANNQLTAEHLVYATGEVEFADHRVQGTNYYGSNLSLENVISLNFFFENVNQNMYAIASYTDHNGIAHEERIEGSKFELQNAGRSGYKIPVKTLAIADGRQVVTVTVYNADGIVVGTAQDSMEGYIARMSTSSALYEMIMKFSVSAYNSFH
jgi:hypothetical protein